MLPFSGPELEALIAGVAVAAFVQRGTLTEGDEVELVLGSELRPEASPGDGALTAVVTAIDPAALVDPASGSARHVLQSVPDGDLAVLRVYDGDRPVLSDEEFRTTVRSIEGAMR